MVTTTTSARRPQVARAEGAPADPAELWERTRFLLYKLAARCAASLRAAGPAHTIPELEELVHEGFIAVVQARARWGGAAPFFGLAKVTARQAIWRYGRACQCRLSPAEYQRVLGRAGRAFPRHTAAGESTPRPAPEDLEQRASRRIAAALLDRLTGKDRLLALLYVEENGSNTGVARRLRVSYVMATNRLRNLFARIRRRLARRELQPV